MSLKLARPRLGPYAVYLILALAALLAYAYMPTRRRQAVDPMSQSLDLFALRVDDAQRSSAVTELAQFVGTDTARVVPALIQTLQDRDPGVRLAAVNALHVVTSNTPQATEAATALVASLRDEDPRVSAQAAGILSTLKPDPKLALPPLISAALPEPDSLAAGVPAAGTATGPVSGEELIRRSQRDHARASAAAALGVLGPHDLEVHKTLVSLANDRVPEVRMVAARLLGQIGPEAAGAFAALRKLTSDPDLYIQARAMTAHRQLSPVTTLPPAHCSTVPTFPRNDRSRKGRRSPWERLSSQNNLMHMRQGKAKTRPCGSRRCSRSNRIPAPGSSCSRNRSGMRTPASGSWSA